MDAKIVLVVGVGRERTSVPDLKGMDLDQAQTALRKAKLKLGPANGDGDQGRSSRARPAAGRAGAGRHRRDGVARDAGEEGDARPAGTETVEPETAAVAGRPAHAGDRRHEGHLDRSARDGRQRSPQRRAR